MAIEPTTLYRELLLKGKTPEEFATAAKISIPTIYRALRGDTITSRSATRIAKALGGLPYLDIPADLVKAS